MFDSDYHSWLRKKYKIENFYKVPKYLKKCCYDVEQELIDTEEVNLVKVSIVEYLGDYYYFELFFDWVGYEKEMEIIADLRNTKPDEIPDFIIAGEIEYIEKTIGKYFPEFIPPFSGCKIHVGTNKKMLFSFYP